MGDMSTGGVGAGAQPAARGDASESKPSDAESARAASQSEQFKKQLHDEKEPGKPKDADEGDKRHFDPMQPQGRGAAKQRGPDGDERADRADILGREQSGEDRDADESESMRIKDRGGAQEDAELGEQMAQGMGIQQVQVADGPAAAGQAQMSQADGIEKRAEIISKIEASARQLQVSNDSTRISVQLDNSLLPDTSFEMSQAADGSMELSFSTTSAVSESFLQLHANAMMSEVSRELGVKVSVVVRQDGDGQEGQRDRRDQGGQRDQAGSDGLL